MNSENVPVKEQLKLRGSGGLWEAESVGRRSQWAVDSRKLTETQRSSGIISRGVGWIINPPQSC